MSMETFVERRLADGVGRRWREWWTGWAMRHGRVRAADQLRSFSDHQLKDIGVDRGAIEFAVRHGRKRRA